MCLRDVKLAYGRGKVTACEAAIAVLAAGYHFPSGETSIATMAAYINDNWPALVECRREERNAASA